MQRLYLTTMAMRSINVFYMMHVVPGPSGAAVALLPSYRLVRRIVEQPPETVNRAADNGRDVGTCTTTTLLDVRVLLVHLRVNGADYCVSLGGDFIGLTICGA
jgi:hypothetical protein